MYITFTLHCLCIIHYIVGAATVAKATKEIFKHAGIGTAIGLFFGGIWHYSITVPEKKKMVSEERVAVANTGLPANDNDDFMNFDDLNYTPVLLPLFFLFYCPLISNFVFFL
jgi:hypothetical protein